MLAACGYAIQTCASLMFVLHTILFCVGVYIHTYIHTHTCARACVCVCVCSVSRLWSIPGGPHQRAVRPAAPGAGQGRGPANHLGGTPQATSWSASANQHQVSQVEVLPGEPGAAHAG